MGVKECFDGVVVRVADWVFDRIPVDLVELCFQFDDRVGYVGIGRRRPAEENDRVGDLQHFVVLRFLVLVNGRDRDPDASETPINAPNIVSSMSASFRFFAELLPITASVIYHSSTDFSIQKRRFAWEQRSVVGTEIIAHREEQKSTAPSRAQRLAQFGDLFYQTVRPYQKNNCLFESHCKSYVFSTGYAQIRPFFNGYFLLSLVQSDFFVKRVLDRCTGTSYPAINSNGLAEMSIKKPCDKREIEKIGQFFRSLDRLITLHQREYNLRVKD